jgi:hypothetical protein
VIRYSFVRLGEKRAAAVLVERRDLIAPQSNRLILQVEELLTCPVMLVARDETNWVGAQAYAHFEPEPYLYALLQARDIDWCELQLPECEPIE